MYEYKTEVLGAGLKLFSDKASQADADAFNEIFAAKCVEGWELVTYSFMGGISVKGALLVTFRRKKEA